MGKSRNCLPSYTRFIHLVICLQAKNPTDAIEKILLDSSKIERFEEEVLSHSNYFTTKEPSKHIKHEVVTAIKPSRPFGSTTTPTTTPTLTTTVRKLMPTLQITPSTTSIRRGTFDQVIIFTYNF